MSGRCRKIPCRHHRSALTRQSHPVIPRGKFRWIMPSCSPKYHCFGSLDPWLSSSCALESKECLPSAEFVATDSQSLEAAGFGIMQAPRTIFIPTSERTTDLLSHTFTNEALNSALSPPSSPSPPLSPVSPLASDIFPVLPPHKALEVLRNHGIFGRSSSNARALAGLQNLGNTCFMNACIQCLSNSPPLALYFLTRLKNHRSSDLKSSKLQRIQEFQFHNPDSSKKDQNDSQGVIGSYLRAGLPGGCSCDNVMVASDNWQEMAEINSITHVKESMRGGGGAGASGCTLSSSFESLIREIWTAKPMSSLCPRDLVSSIHKRAPQFAGYRQHDSQEFLRSLVDGLDEECRATISKTAPSLPSEKEIESMDEAAQADIMWKMHKWRNNSPIQEMFCGQLQSTIECSTCGRRSHCFDPFLDLSLPLPKKKFGAPSTTLNDCMAAFMAEERLEGENAYHCSRCNSPQPAVKKLSVARYPTALVIHVKRITSGGAHFQKDTSFVKFDVEGLNLEAYLSPSCRKAKSKPTYDLYAVCNHTGSMSSGHYTAYCKNVDDGHWYCYNDAKVTRIQQKAVCSSSAYVLFYQMREGRQFQTDE